MRSKLPDLRRETPVTNEEVCNRDWSRKLSQKEYVDVRRHAAESEVEIGVLLRNMKTNKLSLNNNPSPCEVINRKGGEVTVKSKTGVDVK